MNSAEIRKRQRDIEAFVDSLGRFLETMERQEASFVTEASFTPRPGQEAEATRLRFEVDRLAGPAAYTLRHAGVFVSWKPRGTFQTQHVNPAIEWATILDWDPRFPVEAILSCCSQALGILDMQAEAAEERESRPLHRVRVGFPRLPRGWFVRHTGSLVKGVGGIATALLVAFLAYWFGWS